MTDSLRALRHELRTPVNHIVGYTELLIETAEDGGEQDLIQDLEKIRVSARRLLTAITDIFSEEAAIAGGLDPARVHHELRTPLNQIIGYSELLEEDIAEQGLDAMLPDIRTINAAARQLFTLLEEQLPQTEAQRSSGTAAPRYDATLIEPRVAEGETLGARRETPHTYTGSILIVDDNAANRDLLARRLTREGHEVTAAADGREALELAMAGTFDLVLLDIMMPEMDGFAVLEELKRSEILQDVPVIMLSALDDLGSVVRCIEMGAEDYLAKPFDSTLLRARIGSSLEKKRLRDLEKEYLRQVARVTTAAAEVEAGDFEPDSLNEVAGRDDALGGLARVFQRMAREVRAREERLRQQVEQLRIEIDGAKQARQVAEITETDFFQDLQEKARRLRAKR